MAVTAHEHKPTIRKRSRWAGRPGQPRPRIPATATERILRTDEAGQKSESEFLHRGQVVGRVSWDGEHPGLVTSLRAGVRHGYFFEYVDGRVSYAEPFVDGQQHGWAKQYDAAGRLLIECPFKRGTGTDYWCDERGRLAEEHPLVNQRLSDMDRWWKEDQKSVYEETAFLGGKRHGVQRRWDGGAFARGFPRYFIQDQRVPKRTYVAASRDDPSLPHYRPEEDIPKRSLPPQFIRLRERARRRRALTRRSPNETSSGMNSLTTPGPSR